MLTFFRNPSQCLRYVTGTLPSVLGAFVEVLCYGRTVVERTDSTDRAHLPCGSPQSDVEVGQHIKNHYMSAVLCKILQVGISNSNAFISASAVNYLEFIADRITCVLKMFHGMPIVFSILFAVV